MADTLNNITENFQLLTDWEDRYSYLIELGQDLEPFPEEARIDENRVSGCVSKVWLLIHPLKAHNSASTSYLKLYADSDAHIVRGLAAILLAYYKDKSAEQIYSDDIEVFFKQIGLHENLTSQRANGLRAMIKYIKTAAKNIAGL